MGHLCSPGGGCNFILILIFYLFFVALEIKSRALYILGSRSASELYTRLGANIFIY